jgi:hypothetical protein
MHAYAGDCAALGKVRIPGRHSTTARLDFTAQFTAQQMTDVGKRADFRIDATDRPKAKSLKRLAGCGFWKIMRPSL